MARRTGQGNGKSKGRRKRGSKWRRKMHALRNGRRIRSSKSRLNKFNSEKYHSSAAQSRSLAAARRRATK